MEIREIKNFLIIAITNAVRDIQQTIFKVEVENQIEIPKEIEIKNLKEVQEVSGKVEVKKIDEVISNLKKIKEKEIKFPKPLEEVKIKNFDKLINKKEKDIIIPDRVKIENLDGIIKILEEIKNKKIPEPKDVKIPDTIKISNLKDIPKTDEVSIKNLNQLLDALGNMNFTSYDPARPIAVRLSDGKYFYKALTEIVDRVISGGGASNVGLRNKNNERINPATEDKQDTIKTAIDNKELKGNTQPDGSGISYYIKTDNSGRLHTRSFKNAAGDGRRMLVDSDRHGQIDVLASALPTGAATSAKQLANDHDVNVSNQISGFATFAKQDSQTTELQKLTGMEIPAHNYYAITFVASGNGAGKISTIVYKTGGSGGTTVATLTMAYDASDRLISTTKS